MMFADLLQVIETTRISLVDKKCWQSTCIKPVDNLQQTCYHQAGASDANAFWYRLHDLRVSGCRLCLYWYTQRYTRRNVKSCRSLSTSRQQVVFALLLASQVWNKLLTTLTGTCYKVVLATLIQTCRNKIATSLEPNAVTILCHGCISLVKRIL